jgi:hypothetical protein
MDKGLRLNEHPCDDSSSLRDQILINTEISSSDAPSRDESKLMDCQILQTLDGTYLTHSLLTNKVEELLKKSGGRLSKTDIAHALSVADERHIEQCVMTLMSTGTSMIQVGEDYIFVAQYFDELLAPIRSSLTEASGYLSLAEIASSNQSPIDLVVEQVSLRKADLNVKVVTIGGATALVTPELELQERSRIRGAVHSLVSPAQVDDILDRTNGNQLQWDTFYILEVIRDLIEASEVDGVLHESLFVPTIHTKMQRQGIDQHFGAMGFVTVITCQSMGIAPSTMADYVQESFVSEGTSLDSIMLCLCMC